MSIFSRILGKIFPSNHPSVSDKSASATPAQGATPSGTAPGAGPAPGAGGPAATQGTTPSSTAPPVDVEAILTDLAAKSGQRLNWRTSIVDLMKLLQLDSSLAARKELATELGYTGDTSDSAAMNIWLHKQVMRKLAENGGRVPEDLKS